MTGIKLTVRGSGTRRLARARPFIQAGAFLLFLLLVLLAATHPALSRWVFALDPLASGAAIVAGRTATAALIAGVVAGLILALVFGRAWCGWLCPLGAVLDWTPSRKTRPKDADFSPSWRRLKYFLLFLILLLALFGNLSLMFLDPVTLTARTLVAAGWPGFNALLLALEQAAYAAPILQGPVDALEAARGGILPAIQPIFPAGALVALVFLGALALNAVRPRFWCRYVCPLGAGLGLVSKASVVRREPSAACIDCGRCARECPMGTIDAGDGFRSNPAECTLCLECVTECPREGQSFPAHASLAARRPEDPTRRQFFAAAGAAVVTLGALGLESAAAPGERASAIVHTRLIRPPGATEPEFTSKCIRCGLCLRGCPTSGLQPSVDVAGWRGLWTPVLVSRLGHCDYSCNACGQVCPTGAIPALGLEEKRLAVIGQAYIDKDRCIPWADGRTCLVCEEMCPLPEKAIKLEEGDVPKPYVVRERCIGCGICENRCPVAGEAAIRVRSVG